MKQLIWLVALSVGIMCSYAKDKASESVLKGTAKNIDGKSVTLDAYKGKVIMVVNVASRCGFTKQYKQLQDIYAKYKDRGFVILAFPCNQFRGQEPGTDAEIKAFCATKFAVTFPLFSKVDVNGDKAIPLYKYLTSANAPIKDTGPVKWNFEKFLFTRSGKVIARYRSRVTPDDAAVVAAIEKALGPAKDK